MSKRYTDEFKEAAMARVDAGETPAAVIKDLKLSNSSLYQWLGRTKRKLKKKVKAEKVAHPKPLLNKWSLVYLRQGADEITKMLRAGTIKRLDKAHIRLLLALAELEDS